MYDAFIELTATSSFILRPKIFHSLFNSPPNHLKFLSLMLLKYFGDSFQSAGTHSVNSVPRLSKFFYVVRKNDKNISSVRDVNKSHTCIYQQRNEMLSFGSTYADKLDNIFLRWTIVVLIHKLTEQLNCFVRWPL